MMGMMVVKTGQDVFQGWVEVDLVLRHHYLQHKAWSFAESLYQWMVSCPC